MKIALAVVLLCALCYVSGQTPVQKCPQGKSSEELKQTVRVGNCKKTPCKLKKGRTVKAEFRFTPGKDVKTLKNSVSALIVGLPFPFIGVDGTDACDQLYESDATTKTGCPLKAGKEYVYKNQFDILNIYPVIRLVVHWGLTGDDGQDVMCFEVPARIANS